MSSATDMNFAPLAAHNGAPIHLAMQRLWLTGRVVAAGARLVVQHVFQSGEKKPLEVIYTFVLPRDAALRGFRISWDGFEAHSEFRPVAEAVKAYEQGIADGSLSTLARQYGDGIVSLTVGNIRPRETVTVCLEILAGVELRDDGFRFRFPFTLAPAYHSRMRTAVVDGEGEMELPAGEFGDLVLPRFRKDASSLHEVGFELSLLHQSALQELGSPSHAITVKNESAVRTRVTLAPAKDVPNRDLVLDVRYQENQTQVLSGPVREGKRCFAAIAPSTLFGRNADTPRRLVILLDRSGSMQGKPIEQARKAIEACLAALHERDSFGLIVFDDSAEALHPALVPATREEREKARRFLNGKHPRGGTELAEGVHHAAGLLGGEGDILILTDGQVFGTEKILAEARAGGIRISCLGIGSASQDRFLALLARETGGVGRFVTASERVDLAAVELFASMGRPVAAGLKAAAVVQPEPPSAVFAGTPVLLFGELDAGAEDRIELAWDGGSLGFEVPPGDAETGELVRLLQGARLITDWESRYPAEEAAAPIERRRQNRVAARLLELSTTYGLASREMSLVSVVKRQGDRPGELPHTAVVPVGLAQDVSFDAYFFGSSGMIMSAAPTADMPDMPAFQRAPKAQASETALYAPAGVSQPLYTGSAASSVNGLLELAALLEPDGGMPGNSPDERVARTIAAIFAFAAGGHTLSAGAFRLHVARLAGFLQSMAGRSDTETRLIEKALETASRANAPAGPWLTLANSSRTGWKQIEAALK